MSDLDRLYSELATACGVLRIRDPRLELLAMDRALEARYAVGTDGTLGIPHPTHQLIARTYPQRAGTFHSVHENAVWGYGQFWGDDFVAKVVEAWMDSPIHRANLERISDTHWGIGYHVEPPTGSQTAPRIYVIADFTTKLRSLAKAPASLLSEQDGYQFTAMGKEIGAKHLKPKTFDVKYDYRLDIPGRGPHLRVALGGFKHYWIPE